MPNSAKRSGAARQVPISQIELPDDTSQTIFEKQWAVALVNRMFSTQEESAEKGSRSFRRLSVGLTGDRPRAVS
jgi:hypothetical protein